MKTYREPARDVPIVGEFDVVVCGGGPAGVAAALSAARSGARTALLEAQGCLGGIWTAGLMCWIIDADNKGGVMAEMLGRIEERGARTFDRNGAPTRGCDIEAMKLLLDDLCREAGMTVRLHTRVAGAAQVEAGRLGLAITESKSGREAWAAGAFIDCTGDGDLAAAAGCGFDLGHPETGRMQPMSLVAVVSGIDAEAIAEFFPNSTEKGAPWKGRLKAEMERGGRSPSYSKPTLFRVRDDLFMLMANHEYEVSGIDADDLTQATLRGRREVNQLVDGLRSLDGVWRDIRIVATSAQIGVREARRIHGRYEVTADDLRAGATHGDAACQVRFGIDVHSTDPVKDRGIPKAPFRAHPYDIPVRALIARDVDGLMMAGRCISGDFFAHSSYRVTGDAVAMGETAGKVAAIASGSGRLPHEVEWAKIAGDRT